MKTDLNNLSDLYKGLGESIRMRILSLLLEFEECKPQDIAFCFNVLPTKISRHLKYLREVGLVKDYKQGLNVFYQVAPRMKDFVKTALSYSKDAEFKEDAIQYSKLLSKVNE